MFKILCMIIYINTNTDIINKYLFSYRTKKVLLAFHRTMHFRQEHHFLSCLFSTYILRPHPTPTEQRKLVLNICYKYKIQFQSIKMIGTTSVNPTLNQIYNNIKISFFFLIQVCTKHILHYKKYKITSKHKEYIKKQQLSK